MRQASWIFTLIGVVFSATLLAEQPTFRVGFAQDDMANDWRASQVREVAEVFANHPEILFLHTDARGSTPRQMLDIEELVAQGIDLLITSPRDGVVMAPLIAEVYRRGIPVVLLTRAIAGEEYTTFIGADDHQIGRQAARYLAQQLNREGRILVLQGLPTATTTIARTAGFIEELAHYPGLEVAATLPADYLRSRALQQVDYALDRGLKFDAIYAQSDSMAAGARIALLQAGIDPATLPTVGIDYIREAQQAILSGQQQASFTYPTCGREGAEAALALLRGEPVARRQRVESRLITREQALTLEPIF